jgi:hypothetical protein
VRLLVVGNGSTASLMMDGILSIVVDEKIFSRITADGGRTQTQ